MPEYDDQIYIFASNTLVMMTHRHQDKIIKLVLTDLKETCFGGDVYQGQVLRKEAVRAWIDIGETKPALIKKLPDSFKEGQLITVKVDRAITQAFQGKKGAQVSYYDFTIRPEDKGKKIKVYSSPLEWITYLKNISSEVFVLTNSSNVFFTLREEYPNLEVHLKSDAKIPQDVHLEWENLLNAELEISGGGFIVIEETEALTAIDVNTSALYESQSVSFKRDQDWLNFNLKAACLIQEQIQRRDLAGILVIDFPFVKKREHQNQIFDYFGRLKDNRQQVLGFTKAGLFEMTRQKTNESLSCKYKYLKKNRAYEFPH